MKIKRIAILLALLMLAVSTPIWASIIDYYPGYQEEPQSRRPMPGENEETDWDDENGDFILDEEDYPPPEGDTVAVSYVHVTVNAHGITSMTVPGHQAAGFMAFATYDDIEFYVTPPAGTHFTPETALLVSEGTDITQGPIVMSCGRLFFVKTVQLAGNSNDNQEAVQTVDIIFYTGNGLLPMGESGSMMGPVGLLVPHGPVPYPPAGYVFDGWSHAGTRVDFPFNATSSITLEAVYIRQNQSVPGGEAEVGIVFTQDSSEGQAVPTLNTAPSQDTAPSTYAAVFNPSPGVFPGTETGLRVGAYNTVIDNVPAPTRNGYTFAGWMLPNGDTLHGSFTLRADTLLTAVWNADPNATPTPSPTPTPTPVAPAPNPGTGSSGQTSGLTNPSTGPIRVSFMIFAVVIAAGVSAFGITKVSRMHMTAAEKYRSKLVRYNREKRIADLLGE